MPNLFFPDRLCKSKNPARGALTNLYFQALHHDAVRLSWPSERAQVPGTETHLGKKKKKSATANNFPAAKNKTL